MDNCTVFSICESKRNVYPHAKNYEEYAIRLVYSIRKNGGSCSGINIKLWYGEDAPPSNESRHILEDMGCSFVEGKCEYPKYPVHNKIIASNMNFNTEYALWMDSDLYVLGDFSEILNTDKEVIVSPDQNSFHKWSSDNSNKDWEIIYNILGTTKPKDKIECHIDKGLGNFYFCSGIFMFKSKSLFASRYKSLAEIIINAGFTENFTQTALGMAVHCGGYSYDLIPEKYHYFYTLHNKKIENDTVIVHYQDSIISEVDNLDWDTRRFR